MGEILQSLNFFPFFFSLFGFERADVGGGGWISFFRKMLPLDGGLTLVVSLNRIAIGSYLFLLFFS